MMHLVTEYSGRKSLPNTTAVDKVVRAANFQRIFQTLQLIPEAVAMSLFDEALQSDLQQFIQVLTPFLLRLLVREVEQEIATTGGTGGASRRMKVQNPPPKQNTVNVIDELFGFSTISSTTFFHSGVHKVDPKHNRAMALDLIYPSLTAPSASSVSSKRPTPGSKANVSPVPMGSVTNVTTSPTPAFSPVPPETIYKVTGKKGRTLASFASVLWGSFRRKMSMKGWCSESDSFEPFLKVQSLISLPRVLHLQCGNTQADVKDSTTLAGALGETMGQGTTHANYWSHPVLITIAKNIQAPVDPVLGLAEGESRQFAWLPVEIEVCFRTDSDPSHSASEVSTKDDAEGSRLIVSCRVVPFPDSDSCDANSSITAGSAVWIIFDGGKEEVASQKASMLLAYDFLNFSETWTVHTFDLMALVLQVNPPQSQALPAHLNPLGLTTSTSEKKHLVLQINKSADFSPDGWHLFNDFVVQKIPPSEVVEFPAWKHPCMVFFARNDLLQSDIQRDSPITVDKLAIPASVLQLESLSRTPSIRLLQSFATLPGPGDLIAFDGEFVSVSLEKSMINAAGERVVSEEVRQVLARISLLDMGHGPRDPESTSGTVGGITAGSQPGSPGSTSNPDGPGATAFNKNMMRIIADDYILPVEPVLDYVTRFSGITEEDLNPATSKHSILTQRAAYLKLRYFIDAKCIFVGHGLQKDFETANIFVPPEQVERYFSFICTVTFLIDAYLFRYVIQWNCGVCQISARYRFASLLPTFSRKTFRLNLYITANIFS